MMGGRHPRKPFSAKPRDALIRRMLSRLGQRGFSTQFYLIMFVIALIGPGLIFTAILLTRYAATERARIVDRPGTEQAEEVTTPSPVINFSPDRYIRIKSAMIFTNRPIIAECSVETLEPTRIGGVDRIAADIIIPVEPVGVADRIGLQEPAERGGVDAGLVIIHAKLGQPGLAARLAMPPAWLVCSRILEPPDIARARNAIFVVAVDVLHRPARIAHRNHAAALIGVE